MKPDASLPLHTFSATTELAQDAVSSHVQARSLEEWVEQRLAGDFMQGSARTLGAGFMLWLIMLFVLHESTDPMMLSTWAVLFGIMLAYRYFTVQQFQVILEHGDDLVVVREIRSFFRQHAWSWWASAMLAGGSLIVYYGRVEPSSQYLCLMLLAVMGAAGAAFMAPYPTCQRAFSNGLCLCAALSVLIILITQWPARPRNEAIVLIVLILIYRQFILYLGDQLYKVQANSYRAQYGNEQLIQSLRQQTQHAAEAIRMKNSLLASATHDLRQPVHALAFYADWLRNEPQLADSIVPKILVATDSVNALFNSLFDFAKIESEALAVQLGEVDIESLMEELAVQYTPAAQEKGLTFQTRSVHAKVRSDPLLLRRIVANLLANAIRYTESGGVTMSAQVVEGQLRLEVSDTGCGISVEHLPHVFKEFYRAQKHQGTADSFGLGLAIVQRLCQALGHIVTLRSSVGEGTLCRVEMLLATPTLAGQGPSAQQHD